MLILTSKHTNFRFFSASVKPFKKSAFFDQMGESDPAAVDITDNSNADLNYSSNNEKLESANTSSGKGDNEMTVNIRGKSSNDTSSSKKNTLFAFKSNFDREPHNKTTLMSSSNTNKQFKPVVSQSSDDLTKTLEASDNGASLRHSISNKSMDNSCLDDSESYANSSSQADTSVDMSQKSVGLWSIDSESFGFSQQNSSASQSVDVAEYSGSQQASVQSANEARENNAGSASVSKVLKSPTAVGKIVSFPPWLYIKKCILFQ